MTNWRSIVRAFLAFWGPLNFCLDLLWIPGDLAKQAIRDKFAGTLVIKNMAKPVGEGQIIYSRYQNNNLKFFKNYHKRVKVTSEVLYRSHQVLFL